MDFVGKYLRLRRQWLKPRPQSAEKQLHRRRVAQDMVRAGAELESGQPGKAPFLETMPWSDTAAMSYEHQFMGNHGYP